MKKITVTKDMASQRLDKYLQRLLPSCPKSLIYKQLRKKNITLNGFKVTGTETVKEGDEVDVFFSDETFEKFSAGEKTDTSRYSKAFKTLHIDVVSESDDYLIFNKPAGVLSQSDKSGDLSVNDYLTGYLLDKRFITAESLSSFRPSVCNRLDRNTSGLIMCSKTLKGSRELSEKLRNKDMEKYYLAVVRGKCGVSGIKTAYARKDTAENVQMLSETCSEGADLIKTGFEPLLYGNDMTLLKVRLYSGKSHQIRAHLAHLGYPIAGDPKYGGRNLLGAKRQMLHSWITVLSVEESFKAPVPADMLAVIKNEFKGYEDILR